jgi:hypothetical protein
MRDGSLRKGERICGFVGFFSFFVGGDRVVVFRLAADRAGSDLRDL